MANYVIFVGPNGAGKGTLCKQLAKSSDFYEHLESDKLFHEATSIIEKIKKIESESSNSVYLFDIGARHQYYSDLQIWKPYSAKMICLYVPPKISWSRYVQRCKDENKPLKHKTIDDLIAKEFCEQRVKFYNSAKYKVDTSGNEAEAVDQIMNIFKKMNLAP